jgi:hypothetical protein
MYEQPSILTAYAMVIRAFAGKGYTCTGAPSFMNLWGRCDNTAVMPAKTATPICNETPNAAPFSMPSRRLLDLRGSEQHLGLHKTKAMFPDPTVHPGCARVKESP